MKVSLRDVTKWNWIEIIGLEITKDQERHVALNSESIAASKFFPHYVNRAIYLEDDPVGFVQYFSNQANGRPDEIFIDQLMIDVKHQHKGLGTEAILLTILEIRRMERFKSVSICYVDGHDIMRRFFERFGFRVVEQDEFEETIMRLEFDCHQCWAHPI